MLQEGKGQNVNKKKGQTVAAQAFILSGRAAALQTDNVIQPKLGT